MLPSLTKDSLYVREDFTETNAIDETKLKLGLIGGKSVYFISKTPRDAMETKGLKIVSAGMKVLDRKYNTEHTEVDYRLLQVNY